MHCRLYGQTTMFDPTKSLLLKRIRLGAITVFATCCALQVSAQAAPESAANEARRLRVETALHDDAYFNDAHVNVALKNGVVILQGFVFTEWDLLHAIRIAKKAAGDARVVDDLSIELGGRR